MSEQNASERVIIARTDKQGGIIGLYLMGGRVVFRRHSSLTETPDRNVWIDAEFGVDDYRRGIQILRTQGRCVLKGAQDLTIEMVSNQTTRDIFGPMSFSLEIKPRRHRTFFINWRIEDIALKDEQEE